MTNKDKHPLEEALDRGLLDKEQAKARWAEMQKGVERPDFVQVWLVLQKMIVARSLLLAKASADFTRKEIAEIAGFISAEIAISRWEENMRKRAKQPQYGNRSVSAPPPRPAAPKRTEAIRRFFDTVTLAGAGVQRDARADVERFLCGGSHYENGGVFVTPEIPSFGIDFQGMLRMQLTGDDYKRKHIKAGNNSLRDNRPPWHVPIETSGRIYVSVPVQIKKEDYEYFLEHGQPRPDEPAKQTVASSGRCEDWLVGLMAGNAPKEKPRAEYKAEAMDKFSISGRQFEIAWKNAIARTGNTSWSKAGAPKKGG